MPDNTQRFSGRAADYDQYRERYEPAIVLPRLRDWCGLMADGQIADIGAGTGMLADVFLANGNHVFAVEPNADMRNTCGDLHSSDERLTIVDGSAEATTLAPASVDLACVGRAFHWFDVDRAMEEARRILRPDGWFVSIAFGRADNGREENLAIEDLLQSLQTHRAHTHAAYAAYGRLPALLQRDYHHEKIEGELHLTWPELFGLIRSLSHAPLADDPRFPAFERDLRILFERFAVDGIFTVTTRYWITAGRL